MAKIKLKIDKIYNNKVDTKYGQKDAYTLMCGKYGFKGWNECPYKEGDTPELEYDPSTKFQGKNAIYYKLFSKNPTNSMFETILKKLEKIEFLIGGNGKPKDDIPVIEDVGTLPDKANSYPINEDPQPTETKDDGGIDPSQIPF